MKLIEEIYKDLLIHGPIPEIELAMELVLNLNTLTTQ